MGRQIYVETSVSTGDADRLWHLTQDPELHPRWDLRFSGIRPVRVDEAGNQHFEYSLAIPSPRLPFLVVRGTGVSVGERRDTTGRGTSALRFFPDGGLSPLGEGSGYWRYVPQDDRVRFLTGYDYTPGWGTVGRWLDPWLIRPLVGWATAWSFDRLRLWVDEDKDPGRSLTLAATVVVARLAGLAAGAALLRRHSVMSTVAAAALLVATVATPPPAAVPSAGRCLRRPPDRSASVPPASLAGLPRRGRSS